MIGNKSIKETEKAYDLNPVIITVILSLLVIIPQYCLGQVMGLGRKIEALDDFFNLL